MRPIRFYPIHKSALNTINLVLPELISHKAGRDSGVTLKDSDRILAAKVLNLTLEEAVSATYSAISSHRRSLPFKRKLKSRRHRPF